MALVMLKDPTDQVPLLLIANTYHPDEHVLGETRAGAKFLVGAPAALAKLLSKSHVDERDGTVVREDAYAENDEELEALLKLRARLGCFGSVSPIDALPPALR